MSHLEIEVKANLGVDDAGHISGIAWPFGSPDRIKDTITPGAFGMIAGPIPMLAFHNPDDPVGVWDSIAETDHGLEVKGRLLINELARAREVRAMVHAGALRGLSIGFGVKESKGIKGHGRTISALDLQEISLVTVPSHPGARVTEAKRFRQSSSDTLRVAEALQRAAGRFSLT